MYVRLATGNWLVAEVRGDLVPRILGLPTGFWVGVVGLLLASGVLLAILREGRAVERIANSVEAFAATGVPQPMPVGGSPEIAALARRTLRMQHQVATLLNERNAMLGAIAHDIKTYVQRLKLRLDLLDDPDQVQKAARDLDAMNKLLEDALLLAVHANPLKGKEMVDLFAVVSHEVEAARLAGGEIALHRLGGGPFLVAGDRSALSRALSNIIGNALRYGRQARVWVQRNNGTVEIVVDDDGPGIPPAERQAVFTAFHRAEFVSQPFNWRHRPRACHCAGDYRAAARRLHRDCRRAQWRRQTENQRAERPKRRGMKRRCRSLALRVVSPACGIWSL